MDQGAFVWIGLNSHDRRAGSHTSARRCVGKKSWCCQTGLNCRPLHYQWSALPLSYGSMPGSENRPKRPLQAGRSLPQAPRLRKHGRGPEGPKTAKIGVSRACRSTGPLGPIRFPFPRQRQAGLRTCRRVRVIRRNRRCAAAPGEPQYVRSWTEAATGTGKQAQDDGRQEQARKNRPARKIRDRTG